MNNPKIYHYRNHYNGGKFDGTCKIDTGWGIHEDIEGNVNQIRVRLRIEDFDNGYQYIWGVGSGNSQYALMLVRDTNDYYFKVRDRNSIYHFTDDRIPLSSEKIYSVSVYKFITPSPKIYLGLGGKYSPGFSNSQTSVSTGTISSSDIYIGCSSDVGNNDNNFTGTIFDYDNFNDDDPPDIQRLVFYEKYGGIVNSDYVKDFSNTVNGHIIDRPDDFWSFKRNISNYISEKGSIKSKCRQLDTRRLEYSSLKFGVFDYDDIKLDDTIGVYLEDKFSFLYRVVKITPKWIDHINEIECEDILTDLENISTKEYGTVPTTNPATWYYVEKRWWSNYVFVSGDYHNIDAFLQDYWLANQYILKQVIFILQYDNILGISTYNYHNDTSPYYNHSTSAYIDYDKLAFSKNMFKSINKSSSVDWETAETSKMDEIFLDILFVLRLTCHIDNGVMRFYKLNYDTASFSNNETYNREGPYEENYSQLNNVKVDIIPDGVDKVPDRVAYFSPWDGDDIETIEDNSEDIPQMNMVQI